MQAYDGTLLRQQIFFWQAVRAKLWQLHIKLEAGAAKEHILPPDEDPYDRCDPGSGGQVAQESNRCRNENKYGIPHSAKFKVRSH